MGGKSTFTDTAKKCTYAQLLGVKYLQISSKFSPAVFSIVPIWQGWTKRLNPKNSLWKAPKNSTPAVLFYTKFFQILIKCSKSPPPSRLLTTWRFFTPWELQSEIRWIPATGIYCKYILHLANKNNSVYAQIYGIYLIYYQELKCCNFRISKNRNFCRNFQYIFY